MNDLKEIEKYTCVKVYLCGCSEPIVFENDNFKMERTPNTNQITFSNSKSQLMTFESQISGIFMSR